MGCQIVRRNVAKLGDTGRQPFAIFDQDDTKNVMKLALKKHFSLKRGNAALAPSTVAVEAKEMDKMARRLAVSRHGSTKVAVNEAGADAGDEADDAAELQEWVRCFAALLCLA